jgi:hypothetical protein
MQSASRLWVWLKISSSEELLTLSRHGTSNLIAPQETTTPSLPAVERMTGGLAWSSSEGTKMQTLG